MSREIDAYQLIKTFASRNKISSFEYAAFAQAIQRQARAYDQNDQFYRDLALHPDGILVPRLFQLAREGRISLRAVENRVDTIFLPEAFTETVYSEYRRMEENPDIPFPDEESLRLSVPPEWIQAVSVESDLPALVASDAERTIPLYRFLFPDGLKPMVILSVMLGDKLLEYSVLKIRNYLRKGSNKDFIQQRLAGAFAGKDRMLKDGVTSILIRPFDAVSEIRQSAGDFSYSFWAYLTAAIRKDLSSKGDPMPDDIAAFQASYLIDVFNNHYKSKAQGEQEREAAFKTLGTLLRKPPYLYSVEDIVEFRDGQGRPLLGKYKREELETWLQERTTHAPEGFMPELLLIGTGRAKGLIVSKDTLIPYVVKSLREARAAIKTTLTRDWHVIMVDFGSIPAMEDDAAFRAELENRLEAHAPMLSAILFSGLPPLVYQEYRGARDASVDLDSCFTGDKMAGMDLLLDLDRKRLLTDVKMLLPFWYHVPIISWILRIFLLKRRRRDAMRARADADTRLVEADATPARPANARAAEFGQMARAAEQRMLPRGQTLDAWLETLAGRWNTLLDPVAKANLTEDINSLVRDYLRTALRSMRPASFTPERIQNMASTLADRPNLLRIRNHQALEEYIRLYMIKMLKR